MPSKPSLHFGSHLFLFFLVYLNYLCHHSSPSSFNFYLYIPLPLFFLFFLGYILPFSLGLCKYIYIHIFRQSLYFVWRKSIITSLAASLELKIYLLISSYPLISFSLSSYPLFPSFLGTSSFFPSSFPLLSPMFLFVCKNSLPHSSWITTTTNMAAVEGIST